MPLTLKTYVQNIYLISDILLFSTEIYMNNYNMLKIS